MDCLLFFDERNSPRDGNDIIEKIILILYDNDINIIIITADRHSSVSRWSNFSELNTFSSCLFFQHFSFCSQYLHLNSLVVSLSFSLPTLLFSSFLPLSISLSNMVDIADIHFMASALAFCWPRFSLYSHSADIEFMAVQWIWRHNCCVVSYYIDPSVKLEKNKSFRFKRIKNTKQKNKTKQNP